MANKIKNKLLQAKAQATRELEQILLQPQLETQQLYSHLKTYTFARLFLEPAESDSDDLLELARASLAKTLKVAPQDLDSLDLSQTCTGTSSVISKKVLLLISLEQGLHITISPQQSAAIKTLSDLTKEVKQQLDQQRHD
jgi:hypothetical protein